MKTAYLVRHAESEGNVGIHFQGHHTSLTERGRAQAEHVARRAANLDIKALVSSPMVRAYDTAAEIAAHVGLPIESCEHFSERRRPSSIIGTPMTDVAATKLNEAWFESLFTSDTRVEDGENYDDIASRTQRALRYLEQHPSDAVLVVSHGFFMCALLARVIHGSALTPQLLRATFSAFHVSNTGLSVLSYDGEWGVRMWNDHAHLGELRS